MASKYTVAQDSIAPTAPVALSATVATCNEVDLSWTASTDSGGSGLRSYTITRNDGANTTIGAIRTQFADTNWVKSSSSITYTVTASDGAGNTSPASNSVTVNIPACTASVGEQVVDSSNLEPLGKTFATYGPRTVILYTKQNPITLGLDTWAYVNDADTGAVSRFLLQSAPSYHQIATDYVLTSATQLWVLSGDTYNGGRVQVSQYSLNGTPPASATLISTQQFGDNQSYAKNMIVLKSGGLFLAWNEDWSLQSDSSVHTGFAYRSPAGTWQINYPVVIPASPGSGNGTLSQIAIAQHPADGSVWVFSKRDSFHDLIALHFTEQTASGVYLDWVNPSFISNSADGSNGPQTEFPYLAAVSDPTRNAILLAYQTDQANFVFIDPLFNISNAISLKEASATVAVVSVDGSKNFVPFPNSMERDVQFGFSVEPDGTLWLAYLPIDHTALTWNEVHVSKYSNGSWSSPLVAGFNYFNYDNYNAVGSAQERDPGHVIARTDASQVAFLTPDRKVHTIDLSNLNPAPADTTAPSAMITSPANGATVSGTMTVAVTASDNVGTVRVSFLVDGTAVSSLTSTPYTFSWNTSALPDGVHTLQAVAYDAAGNTGYSAIVPVTVYNNLVASNLSVTIVNPSSGSTVPRNQNLTITASANDSVDVTKVVLSVNNTVLCTASVAPYKCNWKVPGKKGTYNIQAKGYDAVGKTASQTITVTAQ